MQSVSYARHRFPPVVIQHAVWLYLRFTLSYRDVEDLLAQRGLDISYETIRRWVLKFGRIYAGNLRRRRPRPSEQWHLVAIVDWASRKGWTLFGAEQTRRPRSPMSAYWGNVLQNSTALLVGSFLSRCSALRFGELRYRGIGPTPDATLTPG